MKKLWLLIFFAPSALSAAAPLKTVYNPFTGRLDYVTNLASATLGDLGFGIQVLDEGTLQGGATWFNFAGAGVTAACSGGTCTITIPGGAAGGGGGSGAFIATSAFQFNQPFSTIVFLGDLVSSAAYFTGGASVYFRLDNATAYTNFTGTVSVRIDELQADLSTHSLRIDEIQADVSTHSIRIDELQADLSTHSLRIDEIQVDLSTHSLRIDELQVDLTTTSVDIDALYTGVNSTNTAFQVHRATADVEIFGKIPNTAGVIRSTHIAQNLVLNGGTDISSGIARSTFNVYGLIQSTSGFQVAGSTMQGVFMLEGGTIQIRNGTNEFTLVFATMPVAGEKLVVASVVGNRALIASGNDATAAGGSGYATIQEEGAGVAQQTTLNFIGASVTAADDAGNSRTNVTITASAGGGGNGLSVSTGSAQASGVAISCPTAFIVLSSATYNLRAPGGGATVYIEIGTNTPKDFGASAVLRYSSTTGTAFWDTPKPREFYWNGASLLAISTGNSANIAPILKTTGTVRELMASMYPSSACRGGNFFVPAYSDEFSTPTFTAIWFTTNPVAGNVVWNFKYTTGIASGESWDVVMTTVVAPPAANNTGGKFKTTITSWKPAGVGGITGRGTLSSLGWDRDDMVCFLVCREQNTPSDGDTLRGPHPFLMGFEISIPQR